MAFRPSNTLQSRTFVGLLIAQFLAAFNDQAIHASAMFFAFHTKLLNEQQAISLMPILFYAPWAIFCTLAGYYADRYSKRHSLVFWKFAEIGICAVALLGFYLGDVTGSRYGPMIVLGCVFLMGMHSAFFVPAKYGVMPEILEPQLLSRGNGLLESLSFLAVILGTVTGGVLSWYFDDRETWIGVILLALAIIGALASLLIETVPAANPDRPFPRYIYGPLKSSLQSLFGVRSLALAAVGIAFFTFVVAYMRQSVYMLGESQIPRWEEWQTSLIVGSTALGIGIGSPLAGWLSGRKIELGLVPLGGIGMVLAAALASIALHHVPWLVSCIVVIGFFSGFYLVPLYTLLQHRAPRASKGDLVATSNFVNVIGAILASVVFFVVVTGFQKMGIARPLPFGEPQSGFLTAIVPHEGRLASYEVAGLEPLPDPKRRILWAGGGLPDQIDPDELVEVVERRCEYRGMIHCYLRAESASEKTIYDNSELPKFLFLGAAAITVVSLFGLLWIMPDLWGRATFAFRHLLGPRVRAVGTHHLPRSGGLILATNMATREEYRYLRSATDRLVEPIGLEPASLEARVKAAREALSAGQVVALAKSGLTEVLQQLDKSAVVLPTNIRIQDASVLVNFGAPLTSRLGVLEAIGEAASAEEDYHMYKSTVNMTKP